MSQISFRYKIESYDNGDVSIRYYPPEVYGPLSLGVVRANVTTNSLNQKVVVILTHNLFDMLKFLSVNHGVKDDQMMDYMDIIKDNAVKLIKTNGDQPPYMFGVTIL